MNEIFANQILIERRTSKFEKLKLSLVVPCYNEQEAIGYFLKCIKETILPISELVLEVIFVNDGSDDNTLAVLKAEKQRNTFIRIVDLARNFGKEAALSAGLKVADGDVIVPIDVDLQDPPELIINMIEKWMMGFDVVLAKRSDRSSDSFFKRISAKLFYKVHNMMATPEIPENVGDFRLMDRAVVNAINSLPESRRFMKGLFAWVGFRTTCIEYSRPPRVAGIGKFNGWRLWNFALEGLTSFSTDPLRIWMYVGCFVASISLAFAVLLIAKVIIYGIEIPGYASVMVSVAFIGGLQLIGLGIIGEYLGRAYIESKRRPIYIIRKIY